MDADVLAASVTAAGLPDAVVSLAAAATAASESAAAGGADWEPPVTAAIARLVATLATAAGSAVRATLRDGGALPLAGTASPLPLGDAAPVAADTDDDSDGGGGDDDLDGALGGALGAAAAAAARRATTSGVAGSRRSSAWRRASALGGVAGRPVVAAAPFNPRYERFLLSATGRRSSATRIAAAAAVELARARGWDGGPDASAVAEAGPAGAAVGSGGGGGGFRLWTRCAR